MQPELPTLRPEPMPQPLAPMPQPSEGGSRAGIMPLAYAAAAVVALAIGAFATGLVHLPGSGTGAPPTSVTESGAVLVDDGGHTLTGRFWTISPELAQKRQLRRTSGLFVFDVFANSPLEKAGVRVNDVIVAMDGVPILTPVDFSTKVDLTPIGQQLNITFDRAGVTENRGVTVVRCVTRESMSKGLQAVNELLQVDTRGANISPACATWTQ